MGLDQHRAQVASEWIETETGASHFHSDYRDFVEWFVARCTTEALSTKGFDDAVGWALETDPETLSLTILAEGAAGPTRRDQRALARRVHCPVLVLSGTGDRVTALL